MATLNSNITRIGLALGGGFARGIAHVGVLRVFEREGIPIHAISGVSSGAIAAAAFASGCTSAEIEVAARAMQLSNLKSSVESLATFAMSDFLRQLLKKSNFEEMRVPLAIVASDLTAGAPVVFKDRGDVLMPIHASCAYPGVFPPVRYMDHCLVDGMVAMDVPAAPLRRMGATHVVSVMLPSPPEVIDPRNMQSVVRRSFQIMMERNGSHWRRSSDVVIAPDVRDSIADIQQMIQAGERAAEAAMPQILKWLPSVLAA